MRNYVFMNHHVLRQGRDTEESDFTLPKGPFIKEPGLFTKELSLYPKGTYVLSQILLLLQEPKKDLLNSNIL